jgi:hypothetical protein
VEVTTVQPTPTYDRILLTSYPRYGDAQAAVDRLADAHFPVEEVSIIGRDLKLVEDVTGRLSYGRAALGGAATGAWIGLLFGLFMSLFAGDATSAIALLFWGLLFGVAGGVVFAVVTYALTGGRRDFVSVSQLVAERYDVVVDARTVDDARRIVGLTTADAPAARSAPGSGAARPAAARAPAAGSSWRPQLARIRRSLPTYRNTPRGTTPDPDPTRTDPAQPTGVPADT